MSDETKPIDARFDVVDRRVLAQGATPEEWAVEVAQPIPGAWTTTLYVGARGFQVTQSVLDEHCMFVGRMLARAIRKLAAAESKKFWDAITLANDLLLDSRVDDPKHVVECHADALPEHFLRLSVGHEAALEALQTVVREWVDPEVTG